MQGLDLRVTGVGFWVSGFGFRGVGFRGLGFRVSGVRVSGFRFRVSDFEVRLSGFGFWVTGFGLRVSHFAFRISGLGVRISGFGFRVSGGGFRPVLLEDEIVGSQGPQLVVRPRDHPPSPWSENENLNLLLCSIEITFCYFRGAF